MEPGREGMFQGRRLVIGTKHGKERVIGPMADYALGVESFAATDFDTDVFGTFTGEVERTDDPVSALRRKCRAAMALHGCDLGIASEGSFGPHPQIPFIPADEEFLLFMDTRNGIEVLHRETSTDTNFSGAEITTPKGLQAFAERALFPSHGLILRSERGGTTKITKGIHDPERLNAVFEDILSTHGSVYAETDMRAMHNPTRMKVIEKAVSGLLEKILSKCPLCGQPGYTVSGTAAGLPCSLCRTPTRSIMTLTYTCRGCGHSQSKGRPDGKLEEDPSYCDHCNP